MTNETVQLFQTYFKLFLHCQLIYHKLIFIVIQSYEQLSVRNTFLRKYVMIQQDLRQKFVQNFFIICFRTGNHLLLCREIPGHVDGQQAEHGSAMSPCHKGQQHPSCIMKTLASRLREVMAPPSPILVRLHLKGCLWVWWTYWSESNKGLHA